MRNRRGIIKIIEATIAIILILSILMVVVSRRRDFEEMDFSKDIPPLLDEIAKNSTLRGKIVGVDVNNPDEVEDELRNFLSGRIITTFDYDVKICSPDDICGLEEYPKTSVFAAERIIASTFQVYDPKKLKIFVWLKR